LQLQPQQVGRTQSRAGDVRDRGRAGPRTGQRGDQGAFAVAEHAEAAESRIVAQAFGERDRVVDHVAEAQVALSQSRMHALADAALVVAEGGDACLRQRLGKQLEVAGTDLQQGAVAVAIGRPGAGDHHHHRASLAAAGQEQRAAQLASRGTQVQGFIVHG
jgi:hypothetical protein